MWGERGGKRFRGVRKRGFLFSHSSAYDDGDDDYDEDDEDDDNDDNDDDDDEIIRTRPELLMMVSFWEGRTFCDADLI